MGLTMAILTSKVRVAKLFASLNVTMLTSLKLSSLTQTTFVAKKTVSGGKNSFSFFTPHRCSDLCFRVRALAPSLFPTKRLPTAHSFPPLPRLPFTVPGVDDRLLISTVQLRKITLSIIQCIMDHV